MDDAQNKEAYVKGKHLAEVIQVVGSLKGQIGSYATQAYVQEQDSETRNLMVGLSTPTFSGLDTCVQPTSAVTSAASKSLTLKVDTKIPAKKVVITIGSATKTIDNPTTNIAQVTETIADGTKVKAEVTYNDTNATKKYVSEQTIYVRPYFYCGCSASNGATRGTMTAIDTTSYGGFAGRTITTTADKTEICLAIPAYLYDANKTYKATIGAAAYPFKAVDGTVTGINSNVTAQAYKLLVYDTKAAGDNAISKMT